MNAPLSRRISSAAGVVGLFAPSTSMRARMRSALPPWIVPPSAAGNEQLTVHRDQLLGVDRLDAGRFELGQRAALAQVREQQRPG